MDTEFLVLHVDDDEVLLDLAAELLGRADSRLRIVTETRPRDALARLDAEPVDAVVSDYQMPEMDGLAFLDRVRDDHPDLPFVLYTGHGSEEIASEAIARGVTDYLQKGTGTDQYTVLANRLTNAIERHRMAATLERREAHLRQAQSVATIGSWWTEIRSDELYWSDGVYEIFETSDEEEPLDHETFLSYVHPDDREFVEEKWTAALAGHPYDIEHRIEVGGQTKWVRERAEITFQDGDPVRATGVVQDVTERRDPDRRLGGTQWRSRAVIDAVDALVVAKDREGVYRLANDTARELLSADAGGVVGRTDHDLFPAPVAERFRADDRRVAETGDPIRREERIPLADGTRTFLTVKSPVFAEDGGVTGVCAVSTDVTEGVGSR